MNSPPPTWDGLQRELEGLRASLPAMQAELPDQGDFLEAFSGVAELIQAAAEYDYDLSHHVWVELNAMLVDAGVLPEEERQL